MLLSNMMKRGPLAGLALHAPALSDGQLIVPLF
jgi:hypothetical protein